MNRKFWQSWITRPLCLISIAVLVGEFTNPEIATAGTITSNDELLGQVDRYNETSETDSLEQVSSVSQLRDVSPTDWAYEALQSLVERYGCIAGYPNGTYRGNKSLSRYEFAAGLNACMNQIERLIASSESVMREDMDKMQRLAEEFQTELATLGTKVDNLEGRTKFLEDNQFSTTTKLTGEVVFGLAGVATGDDVNGNEIDKITILGNRTRLNLSSSFTGKDSLYLMLSAGNFPSFSETKGTFEGDLGFYQTSTNDNNNDIILQTLFYKFPVGDRTEVVVEGTGGISYDFTDTISFLDRYDDSASGAISLFGVRNPIYNQVVGAGVGVRSQLSDNFEVSLGYLTPTANSPNQGEGLFNGAYSAIGQITFKLEDSLKLGLTYVRGYNTLDTFTGSNRSNFLSFARNNFGASVPTNSDSYGVEASWQINKKIVLGAWGGYTKATTLSSLNGAIDRGSFDIWNAAVTLGFPDLLKEGNLGGIVVGVEPKVADSSVTDLGEDPDTSIHVEGFYQYKLSDNIAITPGLVWITAPDHNENNSDVVIGTIRTTFTF
jgi:Carbohydrate-selective porin, OprB family/S-layer homology domain